MGNWLESENAIIDKFFQVKVPQLPGKPGNLKQSCDDFAAVLLGPTELRPVHNQGSNSYTLISTDKGKVVQFRLERMKDDILELAHQIYGGVVPVLITSPELPLPVYISDIILGRVHVLQPFPGTIFPLARQERTVSDLARFIAKATYFPQPDSSLLGSSWTKRAKTDLIRLLKNKTLFELAPELVPILCGLEANIDTIYSLPLVLTHKDLAEVNVFVDDEGNVSGVIDFDNAGIEAFGMSIWGIYECWLGEMDKGRYAFFPQTIPDSDGQSVKELLEKRFWNVFWSSVSSDFVPSLENKEALRVSIAVGVVNRYFNERMLDHIDLDTNNDARSLDYARRILPAVRVL